MGVRFNKWSKKFEAKISINGYNLLLGEYDTYEAADVAYNAGMFDRKNGAYDAYDDLYKEYLLKVEELYNGSVVVTDESLLIRDTNKVFYEWVIGVDLLQEKIHKNELYDGYIRYSGHENVTQRKFWAWMGKYFKYRGYGYDQGRDAVSRWILVFNEKNL